MPVENRSVWYRIGLFLLLLGCGWVALGPIQWGNIIIPDFLKFIYKIGVPIIFFLITVLLYRSERLKEYWSIFYVFFIGGMSFLVAWLVFIFIPFQGNTVEGIALAKLIEASLIVGTIIVILLATKINLKSTYLQKGNLKLGLIYGLAGFVFFVIFSFTGAELLFYATALNLNNVVLWLPWILIFIFANAFMEELLYRGLLIGKLKAFFSRKSTNLLQAIIFALIHFGVTYTSEQWIFLFLNFFLGLFYGFIIFKTDSLIGATLVHAGADFVLIIGIFSLI